MDKLLNILTELNWLKVIVLLLAALVLAVLDGLFPVIILIGLVLYLTPKLRPVMCDWLKSPYWRL